MTERQKEVLAGVVYFYLKTNQPVSSKHLREEWFPEICSATLRREMQYLEERHYLTHLHTSSGRLPTEKGWRFYIMYLLPECVLNPKEKELLLADSPSGGGMEDLFAAQLSKLSEFLQAVSLFIFSLKKEGQLKKLVAVPLEDEVLLILVTDAGVIYQNRFRCFDEQSAKSLSAVVDHLNRSFSGKSLASLCDLDAISWGQKIGSRVGISENLINRLFGKIFSMTEEKEVYVEGIELLLQRSYGGGQAERIWRWLQNKKGIAEFYKELSSCHSFKVGDEVEIFLGQQLPAVGLRDCSLVASHLTRRGEPWATLGVLTPLSSHYAKAVAGVKAVREALSSRLAPIAIG